MQTQIQTYILAILILPLSIVSFLIILKCVRNLLCKRIVRIEDKKVYVTAIASEKHREKIKKSRLTISYKPFIRYATICCLLSYFITNISILTNFSIYIFYQKRMYGRNITGFVTFLSWVIARTLMNSVFLARLKYSFVDTVWMYSKCVFVILYWFLAIITILTLIVVATSVINDLITGSLGLNTLTNYNMPILGFTTVFNVIFHIILMYLFQHRLLQLIAAYYVSFHAFVQKGSVNVLNVDDVELSESMNLNNRSHTTVSLASKSQPNANDSDLSAVQCFSKDVSLALVNIDNTNEDHKDVLDITPQKDRQSTKTDQYNKAFDFTKFELINTITQYTILLSASLLSLFGFFALLIVITSVVFEEQQSMARQYAVFLLVCDSFVNSLCLYLHFSFAIKTYKCCCVHRFCLHTLCESCFAQYINKSIGNQSE